MLQSRSKDDVFSTGYFVEVVINTAGGSCCGSTMRGSQTDKAGQRARERKKETERGERDRDRQI